MRAIVVRGTGPSARLELADVASPALGAGQVRVAVRACGVNFRDVHSYEESAGEGSASIPGTDFSGVVTELGEGVNEFDLGQRVFGAVLDSAYADEVVTVPTLLFALPDSMSFAQGAALPVSGLSASYLVSEAALSPGEVGVSYAAAGGLGCFVGALWHRRGVQSIGLVSTSAKADVALAMGHSDVVNYKTTDPVEEVRRLSGGGAHAVIDSVGGPQFANSFKMLRNGGTVILCGTSAGEPDIVRAAGEFLGSRRNLALREFYLVTHIFDHFNEVAGRVSELLELFTVHGFDPPIAEFEMADFQRALDLLGEGSTVGKLVITT